MAGRDRRSPQGEPAPLPPPGGHVRVSLPDHPRGLRSTVRELAHDVLVIAAPVEPPDARPVEVGAEVVLSWTSDRGLCYVGVQLVERRADPPSWRVRPLAAPRCEQRRASYRVPVMGDVEVRLDGAAHHARLVDLSEGGLRCLLAPGTHVPERSRCGIRLDAVARDLELDGLVVRVREGVDAMVDLGVQFVAVAPAAADELRRFLLEAQLELGRLDGPAEG